MAANKPTASVTGPGTTVRFSGQPQGGGPVGITVHQLSKHCPKPH